MLCARFFAYKHWFAGSVAVLMHFQGGLGVWMLLAELVHFMYSCGHKLLRLLNSK